MEATTIESSPESLRRMRAAVSKAMRQTLKPPPKLRVSEWADAKRGLSRESSAAPGQWKTNRAEYQREILDAFSDPAVAQVVVESAAQVGKTEILNNVVG